MRDRDLLNENYYGSYGQNPNRPGAGFGGNDRDWTNRASDEARSWFGDEDAERRRQMDEQQNRIGQTDGRYNSERNYYPGNNQPTGRGLQQSYYDDYDRNRTSRGRVGFTDEHRRGYNSHSMYAIPGPDPATGRRAYYPHANPEPYENHDRGLGSQFTDEVRSWFGNKEASERRRMDSRQSLGDAYPGNQYYSENRNPTINDRYYNNDRDRDWVRNHNVNNGW